MSSFFHTLVVVGAGLSLANCGGKARGEADEPGSGGMSNAGKGGGGAGRPSGGTSSGGTSLGGTGGSSTGGSFNTGGTSIGGSMSMGGVGGSTTIDGGSPMGGLPGVLPATQWSCGWEFNDCQTVEIAGHVLNGVWLGEPCELDLSRPLSVDDCPPGDGFQCLVAQYEGQAMLVNCACTGPDASCHCPSSLGSCLEGTGERCVDEVSLCGCARTCILL